MATSIANLTQIGAELPEAGRFDVLKVVLRGAPSALRSLYPEPRAASVEDKLVRLMLTAEVHCREYLDVKEVR